MWQVVLDMRESEAAAGGFRPGCTNETALNAARTLNLKKLAQFISKTLLSTLEECVYSHVLVLVAVVGW